MSVAQGTTHTTLATARVRGLLEPKSGTLIGVPSSASRTALLGVAQQTAEESPKSPGS
jgi:hypothetical protein